MVLIRKLAGLTLALVAFLAGCWGGGKWEALYGPQPLYGIQIPPHDPTVTLDDFSYAPPSPASPGDTLAFTATTNKPTDAATITVSIGDPPEYTIWLNDDGWETDEAANDGIWQGQLVLTPETAPAPDLPVNAELLWLDGYQGQELAGEDLTILEGSE